MQIPHYALTLNVNAQKNPNTIIAKQYDDKSRYIDIVLTADSKPIMLNKERVTLTVQDKKKNKTIALKDCTVVDSVIIVELTAEILSVATTLECEITVYGTNKEILTSARFNCVVDAKLSTEVVERENDFSALQTALSDVASTSNRINEVSSRIQPIALGGTGATTALEALNNLGGAVIGLATAVPANANLDDYLTTGTYDVPNSVISSLTNSPFSNRTYKLYVIACASASYIIQVAISPYYGEICIRDYNYTSKTWNSWNKIVSQPTTVSEIGTWTPTAKEGTITVKNAGYVYDGNTIMVNTQIVFGSDFNKSANIYGLPIARKLTASLSAYVNDDTTMAKAIIMVDSSADTCIKISSQNSIANKSIIITGTYLV